MKEGPTNSTFNIKHISQGLNQPDQHKQIVRLI